MTEAKGKTAKQADGSFGYQSDDEHQLHSIGFYKDGVFVPVASCTYGQAEGHVASGTTKSGKDGE